MPGTSIQYERPKCRTKVKRKRSRRGKKPRRNNSKKGSKGSKSQNGGGKKGRKHACIQADRSEFNTQVVNLIITDYRTRHGRVPDGTMDHRREMIEWKFAQMDLDHNGKRISKDNELMNELICSRQQKNETTKPRIHEFTNLKCCKMSFNPNWHDL